MATETLDKVLHQPIRTRIIAHLALHDECDYTSLKKELDLTDGHMTTHMRELLAHKYVSQKKAFVDNKPRTTYRLTKTGRMAFTNYIKSLKKIIML